MIRESHVQLGKQGITENFLATLGSHFENHKIVKISVLKSARTNKEDVAKYAKEIEEKLGNRFVSKTIGFKIILRKMKNPVR